MPKFFKVLATLSVTASLYASAQTPPVGEIKGDAWTHTKESLAAMVQQADVCLPAAVTGAGVICKKFKDLPATTVAKPVPTIVFLHGSSGLGLQAIGQWQQWLATLGFASIAPDSFALQGRVTYKSPIDKASYERIHALRLSEIEPTLAALATQTWADNNRLILAGTSEGAVPVARYVGTQFAARMLYAWSCEQNYFVTDPRNAFEPKKPVLNIISNVDPFFSKTNAWLGNNEAQGNCAAALKENAAGSIVLIPNAPHTLLNLPAARQATAGFLAAVLIP